LHASAIHFATSGRIEPIAGRFDAVVMLTWSDWHSEPRSNRYHFATRFARHLPVIFVQPDGSAKGVQAEKVRGHDIEILHVNPTYGRGQSIALQSALSARGIRKPLLWIYNVHFIDFVARSPSKLRVFHATEDYVTPPASLRSTAQDISGAVKLLLKNVDLVVAVSQGVANAYRTHGEYVGDLLLLPNGCDFEFWQAHKASEYVPPASGRPVALYQGALNARVDYELLVELAKRLDGWDFWCCGKNDRPRGWAALSALRNVRYFGELDAKGIAQLARQAKVGLIPFVQDALMRRSQPLKAYEYVACGLPVVTSPIDALSGRPDLFCEAATAEGFAAAICELAPSRDSAQIVEHRLAAAREQSYDVRFARLLDRVLQACSTAPSRRPRLNILMLYDDAAVHVGTISEHLHAFTEYSRHRLHFLPATKHIGGMRQFDASMYDALVIHYSVRVSIEDHLSDVAAHLLANYAGPKLLFIQDEYDATEMTRRWIERLGIDGVFTNVPLNQVGMVYPRERFPHVDFLPTLTGYVPEDPMLDFYAMPIGEREIMIGYRGRCLPHQYGDLGHEKYRIGIEMKRCAEAAGFPVDIEVEDAKRIYGADWYRFLGSCRATLGTESGSNVFDEDGNLAKLAKIYADWPYEEFAARYLQGRQSRIRMNQISPKIFEAIRLRTALVLFEGSYSGVVRPETHYITLKKDFSNVQEVLAKLADLDYVQALTERAYEDIIVSGRYSYATFIQGVDRYLEGRCRRIARARVLSAPIAASFGGDLPLEPAFSPQALLDGPVSRSSALSSPTKSSTLAAPSEAPTPASLPTEAPTPTAVEVVRFFWRLIPTPIRYRLARAIFVDTRCILKTRRGY